MDITAYEKVIRLPPEEFFSHVRAYQSAAARSDMIQASDEYAAARATWAGDAVPDDEETISELVGDLSGTTDLDSLTDAEYMVLTALLTSPSLASAARAAGVSRTTIYRLLSDEEFVAALEAQRKELRAYVSGMCAERVSGLALDALAALEVSVNDYRPGHESERLRAAETALKYAHAFDMPLGGPERP